jgi:hypothetical protein
MSTAKIFRFYATTIPGLEDVVVDGLKERLPEAKGVRVEGGRRHSRVFFRYERSPRQLQKLRGVFGVFALLSEMTRVTVGKPGLERICRDIEELDLEGAFNLARGCWGEGLDISRFQLSVTVQGTHRFSSSELSRGIHRTLAISQGLKPGSGRDILHLHMSVTGKKALLGLRLTPAIHAHSREGMGPELAFCLGRILDIQERDALFCYRCSASAMGEIVRSFSPGLSIGGSERWLKQGGGERDLEKFTGKKTVRVVARGEELPIQNGGMSCLIAGIPTGKEGELWEWARILPPGGVGALVAEAPKNFVAELKSRSLPFEIMAGLPIIQDGRPRTVFIIERLEEEGFGPDLLHIDFQGDEGI